MWMAPTGCSLVFRIPWLGVLGDHAGPQTMGAFCHPPKPASLWGICAGSFWQALCQPCWLLDPRPLSLGLLVQVAGEDSRCGISVLEFSVLASGCVP